VVLRTAGRRLRFQDPRMARQSTMARVLAALPGDDRGPGHRGAAARLHGARGRAKVANPADRQDLILRTIGLRKHFGGVLAVNGVDLSVPPGDVRAIIGPNGAGKTTLFNLLT